MEIGWTSVFTQNIVSGLISMFIAFLLRTIASIAVTPVPPKGSNYQILLLSEILDIFLHYIPNLLCEVRMDAVVSLR